LPSSTLTDTLPVLLFTHSASKALGFNMSDKKDKRPRNKDSKSSPGRTPLEGQTSRSKHTRTLLPAADSQLAPVLHDPAAPSQANPHNSRAAPPQVYKTQQPQDPQPSQNEPTDPTSPYDTTPNANIARISAAGASSKRARPSAGRATRARERAP